MDKSALATILLLLWLYLATETKAVAEDRANKSSLGGILWASGKDESDFLAALDADDDYDMGEKDGGELTGGFSSLESMLQWAIGHSDPEKLKEKASDVQRLSATELSKRQAEIQELMEKLKMPSDAELMKIAIADLNNTSISLEERQRALNELLILVEPIDNANDLDKLGGLVVVVRELENSEPDIRTTSAWILGKASQNNELVQNQILELGVLTRLMKMVKSSYVEEALKALYAISALIRNNDNGQELFNLENGYSMLQEILSNITIDIRLQKKALLLVADLADYQQELAYGTKLSPVGDHHLFKSVVDLTSTNDIDLLEKALLAIKSLLRLPSIEPLVVLRDICGLEDVLERIKVQLEDLTNELGDYAQEMESLRREVHITFHRKLEKVSWVPT
ncbi:hypothetical protein HPP92_006799 [Vanilla planifolia]|uniref:Nucleotide exchange factor Fes1 domain-containing protein n=1 Tax=Vanilla planifolia TaxID=51239 RepID=A0A835V5I9_VANPL|nr:hypothetical protein HPP92_007055 [Vanilla planifolia]KAG0489936.1 hypothetical protein HPP92_006799 [Vanilla planifolia]